MTLNGEMVLILHYFNKFGSFVALVFVFIATFPTVACNDGSRM